MSSSILSSFVESTSVKVLFTKSKSYYYVLLANSKKITSTEYSTELYQTYKNMVEMHKELTPDDQKIFLLPPLEENWKEQDKTATIIMKENIKDIPSD